MLCYEWEAIRYEATRKSRTTSMTNDWTILDERKYEKGMPNCVWILCHIYLSLSARPLLSLSLTHTSGSPPSCLSIISLSFPTSLAVHLGLFAGTLCLDILFVYRGHMVCEYGTSQPAHSCLWIIHLFCFPSCFTFHVSAFTSPRSFGSAKYHHHPRIRVLLFLIHRAPCFLLQSRLTFIPHFTGLSHVS